MSSYIIILVISMILDSLLSAILPFDPSYVSMSAVPQLAFIVLMLITRKCELKHSIAFALILGLLQDIYGNTTFLLYICVNVAMIFVASFWNNGITDTIFENFFFVMTILFLREISVYFVALSIGISRISFITFLTKREFFTLLLNALLFFMANFFVQFVTQYLEDRDIALRKNEKVIWINMNLKEERK